MPLYFTCPDCGRTHADRATPVPTPCAECVRLRAAASLCVRVASPHDQFTASDFVTEPGVR